MRHFECGIQIGKTLMNCTTVYTIDLDGYLEDIKIEELLLHDRDIMTKYKSNSKLRKIVDRAVEDYLNENYNIVQKQAWPTIKVDEDWLLD